MREGRGKETEEEKGSRGRGGKQGCRGGGRESRQQSTRLKDLGKQRRREAYQAEGDVPDGGADNSRAQLPTADGGAYSRQSRCGPSIAAATTCDEPTMLGRLHGRCGRAVMQGPLRGMRGRLVDSSRGAATASRARGSPAACYLPLPSPALTVNASRGRFPARGAYFGRRAVDFPRLLLFAQACVRFRARQLSFWRPSAAIHSASAAQL